MTIVKIAVKALAAPIILVLGAVYVLGNALISMSSPLTNVDLFVLSGIVEREQSQRRSDHGKEVLA